MSATTPAPPPPTANAWRRLLCSTYESVILFGVVFFFGYGYSALVQFKGHPGVARWGLQAFLFVVLGLYFSYFWSSGRRTLPMKTLGVSLQTRTGAALSPARALFRYLVIVAYLAAVLAAASAWGAAWILLAVAPWLPMLFDSEHRALQDLLAGTRMVMLPPEAAPQRRTQST